MLGLTIEKLEIEVNTTDGKFSCELPFRRGLNVIRADNSSGKSTCINAIAYGLGLEEILGPSRKRPFPKSLYEEIYHTKGEQKPYYVSTSLVRLRVTNQKGSTAKLTREIKGNDRKIAIVEAGNSKDYFLGSAGKVGSAKSERGFHFWLADFLGWHLPTVVNFDGDETRLYIECIFPLFFIEQKRGWSEIQANTPTHYGIRNVRKTAAEFCLGIESFEHEKKVALHKKKIQDAEDAWKRLITEAEVIADLYSVEPPMLPGIAEYQDNLELNFSHKEGEVLITTPEKQRALRREIERLSKDIRAATPNIDKFSAQQANVRRIRRELSKNSNTIETQLLAIRDTERKIETLKRDYDQYQQLRRLKKVGSEIDAELDTRRCPICESDLYDTLGSQSSDREPMTLEENIDFLRNQLTFYESVNSKQKHDLRLSKRAATLTERQLEAESQRLDFIREEMDDLHGASTSLLREKIKADTEERELKKLSKTIEGIRKDASSIHSLWKLETDALRLLRKNSSDIGGRSAINELEAILRTNLYAFKFNRAAVSSISVSSQTLRPEQEGYDIVAESSASDYIRIIWAYTLGLMQLASRESRVRHGGFVVFDEPRQHEANMVSFTNLIEEAAKSSSYGGQVIFATSLERTELDEACKHESINLMYFDDYILSLDTTKVHDY